MMVTDERLAELSADVGRLTAELQQLKLNPPDDVAAARDKVSTAIEELKTAKTVESTWHTRTRDLYAQMRRYHELEQAVRTARRDRAIVGRSYDVAVAELSRKLLQAQQYLQTAQMNRNNGAFIFSTPI